MSFPGAIERIFQVKGRPVSHPVIVHIAGVAALSQWAREVPPSAVRLGEAFWPGPLTLVLPRRSSVPNSITGGQDTVAVRSPAHPLFTAVLAALDEQSERSVGIAAPSANRFGHVSPTTADHVEQELGDRLIADRDVILDGGQCALGVESTIVIWTGGGWRIAREGGVSREQLGDIVQLAEPSLTEVRVPGALASHYAPKAQVVVVDSVSDLHLDPNQDPARIGLLAGSSVATPALWYRLATPHSTEQYAHAMYSALRKADDLKLRLVVAVPPPTDGLGAAIRDRLTRAAHS